MMARKIEYTDGGDFEATMEQVQMAVGFVRGIADLLHSDPTIHQFNVSGTLPDQIRKAFPKRNEQ